MGEVFQSGMTFSAMRLWEMATSRATRIIYGKTTSVFCNNMAQTHTASRFPGPESFRSVSIGSFCQIFRQNADVARGFLSRRKK